MVKLNTSCIKKSQESETLLINEVSRLRDVSGETVFKFGFGQSPFLPPQYVIEKLADYSPRKEYVAVQGIQELREAVATFHNHFDKVSIKPDNVLIGPGSKMLIYCALAAFESAHVYLVTPSWVSYEPQAKLTKLTTTRIKTSFESRWRLTPRLLEEAFENRDQDIPGVLILNYPGNPDGLTYSEDELIALASVLKKYNILVISDEIYGLLNHSGAHQSIARFYPEGTIITSGLSKWCGAGGWRLGVALLPENLEGNLKKTMVGIASETYSCASTPVQYAAIHAYQINDDIDQYLAHQRRILSLAANYMCAKLSQSGVNLHEPQGGFYLNPDFSKFKEQFARKGIHTNEELCAQLIQDTGVAILPGNAFGYDQDDLVARVAFVDFNGVEALAASESIGIDTSLDERFLIKYCPKIVEGTRRMVEWLS